MRLNAKQIANYTGGSFVVSPLEGAALLTSITWDSREVEPDGLFVALAGERVDGHDFIDQALQAGARGVLVTQAPPHNTCLLAQEMGAAIIEVPNTYTAITDLARVWRDHLKGKVIALTGSTGKTTTKNLMRDVIAAEHSVVATKANQNNELGVPRTILAANPETEVVLVEMGMRGSGQIAELCDLVRPDWGLITNVGKSHIELLGSVSAIASAKAELFEALPDGTGRAFVNGADPHADFLCEQADLFERHISVVGFDGSGVGDLMDVRKRSLEADAYLWAEDIELDDQGRASFVLCAQGFDKEEHDNLWKRPCHCGLQGLHNVANACAAASVGLALGMRLDTIAQALNASVPESGRQEVLEARGGYTVINDAYNANPDSMRASLATFCSLKISGKRYAVLGDMGELGDFAEACHRGIGADVAQLPLDELICVGELSQLIADGALDSGMDPAKVVRADSIADVLGELDIALEPGDAVLVKGSHFMGLNRVVEGLVN